MPVSTPKTACTGPAHFVSMKEVSPVFTPGGEFPLVHSLSPEVRNDQRVRNLLFSTSRKAERRTERTLVDWLPQL